MKSFAMAVVLLAAFFATGCSATRLEKDKAAIKAVLRAETEAYYRQDFTAWKETYLDAPYFRSYGYWEGYPEKVRYYNGTNTNLKF